MANIIVSEWLTLWTSKFANPYAQHKRKVKNSEKALIEIVKYGSKVFTEPGIDDIRKGKEQKIMHVAALDNIFIAMKGLRIFERFGFNLQPADEREKRVSIVREYHEWVFDPKYMDWFNINTGERLTDFNPGPGLQEFLDNCINNTLQ